MQSGSSASGRSSCVWIMYSLLYLFISFLLLCVCVCFRGVVVVLLGRRARSPPLLVPTLLSLVLAPFIPPSPYVCISALPCPSLSFSVGNGRAWVESHDNATLTLPGSDTMGSREGHEVARNSEGLKDTCTERAKARRTRRERCSRTPPLHTHTHTPHSTHNTNPDFGLTPSLAPFAFPEEKKNNVEPLSSTKTKIVPFMQVRCPVKWQREVILRVRVPAGSASLACCLYEECASSAKDARARTGARSLLPPPPPIGTPARKKNDRAPHETHCCRKVSDAHPLPFSSLSLSPSLWLPPPLLPTQIHSCMLDTGDAIKGAQEVGKPVDCTDSVPVYRPPAPFLARSVFFCLPFSRHIHLTTARCPERE